MCDDAQLAGVIGIEAVGQSGWSGAGALICHGISWSILLIGPSAIFVSVSLRYLRSPTMSRPFIFVATNKVREGKLEAEKRRVPGWVQFIHDNEPRTIGFHEYRSEDGTEVEYIQIHPDTDSFEHHMRVLAELSDLSYKETLEGTTNIRIYGRPTEAILEMLKSAAGAGVPVTIFPEHFGGFTRLQG
jgi:hypothetical protein